MCGSSRRTVHISASDNVVYLEIVPPPTGEAVQIRATNAAAIHRRRCGQHSHGRHLLRADRSMTVSG